MGKGPMRKGDDLDLERHMREQAQRDAQPTRSSAAPEHPGDECPCEDCKASR
jgi:hypothetical protein